MRNTPTWHSARENKETQQLYWLGRSENACMSLPNLATLSLATPTGARPKAQALRKKEQTLVEPAQSGSTKPPRRALRRAGRRPSRESGGESGAEPPQPPPQPNRAPPEFIDALPSVVYQMVAHNLVTLMRGKPSKLCKDLANWCAAAPKQACDAYVWREAYALAFGLVKKPGEAPPDALFGPKIAGRHRHAATWKDAFYAACRSLDTLPVVERLRWARAAEWDKRDLDQRLWEMGGGQRALSPSNPLRLLLIARGGAPGRWLHERELSKELLAAVLSNASDAVWSLLERGAWADYVRHPGEEIAGTQSVLAAAARRGRTDIVQMLLDFDVGDTLDGVTGGLGSGGYGTPLRWAVAEGHAGVAELLIDAGAKADSVEILASAVYNQRNDAPECVRLLLAKGGADPNGASTNEHMRHLLWNYDASLAVTPRNVAVFKMNVLARQLLDAAAPTQSMAAELEMAVNVLVAIDDWIAKQPRSQLALKPSP